MWYVHDRLGPRGWGPLDDLLWLLLMLGLLALIGVVLVRLLRSPTPGSDRALEIARERYARGEISLEEFENLKRNLRS